MTDSEKSPSLNHLSIVSHIKQRLGAAGGRATVESNTIKSTRTMAPVGMIGTLASFSPEVGIISLVAFLVLSVTLLALCARCNRKPTNAYDVNGTTNVGAGGANGITNPNMEDNTNLDYSWRNHKSMPPSTLERNTHN